jgi:hypothetical protein
MGGQATGRPFLLCGAAANPATGAASGRRGRPRRSEDPPFVAAQTTSSLRSVLGAQLGGSVDVGLREKLLTQFRLGWSHEYAATTRPVSAALAGAPTVPFTTSGASPQRDGTMVGVSANAVVADEGDFSGRHSTHALTAGAHIT